MSAGAATRAAASGDGDRDGAKEESAGDLDDDAERGAFERRGERNPSFN